jgi:hypothetical protein
LSKDGKAKFDRLMQLNKMKKKIYNDQDASQENQGDLIKQKEVLMKKIDRKWNTLELVPKGIKEIKKLLETGSGNYK